jgi:type IV pilus assembly protein PilX
VKKNLKLVVLPKQRGFALLAAMMFMIGLTVLAVTVLRSSTLGEKIAGNDLDRMRAYQAAEATIRDAQRDILQINAAGASCTGVPPCRSVDSFGNPDAGLADLPIGCTDGLCHFVSSTYNSPTFKGPWEPGANGNANFAQFGQMSGAVWTQLSAQLGTNVQLSQRPRYWIEIQPAPLNGKGYRYRISAQAWGVNQNTTVTLQEIYYPGI